MSQAKLEQRIGGAELTEKEVAILGCVAVGLSLEDIARFRQLSPFTVKSHLQRIYSKLYANDRAHAVALAIRQGAIHV